MRKRPTRQRSIFRKDSRTLPGAISIDNDLAEAFTDRGALCLDTGDQVGALADLTRALALNPRIAETHYVLGYLRVLRNEFEAAIADFDRAIQLKPEVASAYHGR